MANMTRGGDRRSKGQNCTLTIDDAAKEACVSSRTVKTAKAIKEANPALAEKVKQGKTKLSEAAKEVEAKKPGSTADKKVAEDPLPSSEIALVKWISERASSSELSTLIGLFKDLDDGDLYAIARRLTETRGVAQPSLNLTTTAAILVEQHGFNAVRDEVLNYVTPSKGNLDEPE